MREGGREEGTQHTHQHTPTLPCWYSAVTPLINSSPTTLTPTTPTPGETTPPLILTPLNNLSYLHIHTHDTELVMICTCVCVGMCTHQKRRRQMGNTKKPWGTDL